MDKRLRVLHISLHTSSASSSLALQLQCGEATFHYSQSPLFDLATLADSHTTWTHMHAHIDTIVASRVFLVSAPLDCIPLHCCLLNNNIWRQTFRTNTSHIVCFAAHRICSIIPKIAITSPELVCRRATPRHHARRTNKLTSTREHSRGCATRMPIVRGSPHESDHAVLGAVRS